MRRVLLLAIIAAFVACEQGIDQDSTIYPPTEESQQETETEQNDSEFGATIDRDAYTLSAVDDFGVIPNSTDNQSAKLQGALDYIEQKGGGNLTIPAGEYYIADLYMRSNVHILVSKDATLKPYVTATATSSTTINMLNFTRASSDSVESGYVENCSISCLDEGEQYTVDYSHLYPDGSSDGVSMVRFTRSRMVRNFTIADVHIKDNYTKYCGIIFVGSLTADVLDKWEVARPENGVISNCSINNASHGYGLTQLHAAGGLRFSNLRAKGGVTLRLEGHTGENVGVYDIYAEDIYNEQGKCAVMFQPHVVHHGTVTVKNVTTVGSAFGVLIRSGFINNANLDNPDAEEGSYASDSTIDNINCTYGRTTQIEEKDCWIYDPSEYQYIVKEDIGDDCYQVVGPSYAAVFDNTDGDYLVTCTNITFSGDYVNHPECGILYTSDINDLGRTQSDTWTIGATISAFDD